MNTKAMRGWRGCLATGLVTALSLQAEAARFDTASGELHLPGAVLEDGRRFENSVLRVGPGLRIRLLDTEPVPSDPVGCADVNENRFNALSGGMQVGDLQAAMDCLWSARRYERPFTGDPNTITYVWRDPAGDTVSARFANGVLTDLTLTEAVVTQGGPSQVCPALTELDLTAIGSAGDTAAINAQLGCGPYERREHRDLAAPAISSSYRWRDALGGTLAASFNAAGDLTDISLERDGLGADTVVNVAASELYIPRLAVDRDLVYAAVRLAVNADSKVRVEDFEFEGVAIPGPVCEPFAVTQFGAINAMLQPLDLRDLLKCGHAAKTVRRQVGGGDETITYVWRDTAGDAFSAAFLNGGLTQASLLQRNTFSGQLPATCPDLTVEDALGVASGARLNEVSQRLGCTYRRQTRRWDGGAFIGAVYHWRDPAGNVIEAAFDRDTGRVSRIAFATGNP